MENTEHETSKVPIAARVDRSVFDAVEQLAKDDERTISNTVERLLKQSPPVQQILESERVAA